ncbi:hypothetical protein EBB04_06305 [Sinorhizobium meliloti]|nr:hypothetical protein EBB04_06305 [Sinorhizobium meliloti]
MTAAARWMMALLVALISVLVTEMRAAPRLRRGKRSFSRRTWSGWIPVTSTASRSIPLESITFMILGRPDLAKIIVI